MRINIVTEKSPGWVLRRIAESYAKNMKNASVSTEADSDADINFYVNYALFKKKTKIDVCLFTHREKDYDRMKVFNKTAEEADWCVAMCRKTFCLLPKEKSSVIHVAPDEQFYKGNIILGVVGREYKTGRKRFDLMDEIKNIPGIEVRVTNGEIPWERMPDFYRSIDYLLILSDNEGGPVPLLEALAMGVPVISSDVGFVEDFTTIRYKNINELKDIINRLVISKNAWQISAQKLMDIFNKLWNKNYL